MNCCRDCVCGLISILYFLAQTITILVMMPDICTSIGAASTTLTQIFVYVWLLVNDVLIVTVWLSLQKHDVIMNFVCTNIPDCDDELRCCGRGCEYCFICTRYSRFLSERRSCSKLLLGFFAALSELGLLIFMLITGFNKTNDFVFSFQNI